MVLLAVSSVLMHQLYINKVQNKMSLNRNTGVGNGNPLQYSSLENSMDREEPGGLQSMGSQRVRHDQTSEHANRNT